jgi:hypothetical protein
VSGNLRLRRVIVEAEGPSTQERYGDIVGVVDSWPLHDGSDKYVVLVLVQIP